MELEPEVTDDDLMCQFAHGNTQAFDVLFARYHAPVFRFAQTILRDRHKAEDTLQEVFVAVSRAAATYRPAGRFKSWILRITRNRCLNRVEAERSLRVVASDAMIDVIEPRDKGPLPGQRMERDEELGVIRDAIARLPSRQCEALSLFCFEQMRYHEIASVMDMPINTVKTLIHRARATLAKSLARTRGETT